MCNGSAAPSGRHLYPFGYTFHRETVEQRALSAAVGGLKRDSGSASSAPIGGCHCSVAVWGSGGRESWMPSAEEARGVVMLYTNRLAKRGRRSL